MSICDKKDNNELIRVFYYKCPICGSRVGVPEDDDHILHMGNGIYYSSKEFELFYCNICKEFNPYIYCGYKIVEK